MVFVSFRNFVLDNTRVIICFFPECNIRLYDKNSESDYFFFLHQNQNIVFSQVKWSFPYSKQNRHFVPTNVFLLDA
jgi:hypothetical protein